VSRLLVALGLLGLAVAAARAERAPRFFVENNRALALTNLTPARAPRSSARQRLRQTRSPASARLPLEGRQGGGLALRLIEC
jgi:hypothetical protein